MEQDNYKIVINNSDKIMTILRKDNLNSYEEFLVNKCFDLYYELLNKNTNLNVKTDMQLLQKLNEVTKIILYAYKLIDNGLTTPALEMLKQKENNFMQNVNNTSQNSNEKGYARILKNKNVPDGYEDTFKFFDDVSGFGNLLIIISITILTGIFLATFLWLIK